MIYFLTAILLIFLPLPVQALEISEIAYDLVGSDYSHEWVEIHNESSQSIDLTGYFFADKSTHALSIPPNKGSQGSLILKGNEYFIIADNAEQFLIDHPNYSGSVIDSTMNLPNYQADRTDIFKIAILDSQKIMVSEALYLPTQKGTKGYTLELDSQLTWVDSEKIGGSPGQQRPPPTPPKPVPKIKFNEIVSNPIGSDEGSEKIELISQEQITINLENYYITDQNQSGQSTNKFKLTSGDNLEANGLLVINLTGSFINNENEKLLLFTSDDQLVDTVDLIGKAKEGYSFGLIGGEWNWSSTPTIGGPNILAFDSPKINSPKPQATKNQLLKNDSQLSKPTNRLGAVVFSPILKVNEKLASSPELTMESTLSVTKRGNNASTKPSVKVQVSGSANLDPKLPSLPTDLNRVAGVSVTEPRFSLLNYWRDFLPHILIILVLGYGIIRNIYKKYSCQVQK